MLDETSCNSTLPIELETLDAEDVSLVCDCDELSLKLKISSKTKLLSQEKGSPQTEEFSEKKLRFWFKKKVESKSKSISGNERAHNNF